MRHRKIFKSGSGTYDLVISCKLHLTQTHAVSWRPVAEVGTTLRHILHHRVDYDPKALLPLRLHERRRFHGIGHVHRLL